MQDEEPVDAIAVEGPDPELAPAVDEVLTGTMVIADRHDQHDVMVVMDNHDTAMLLSQIQGAALRKWVYKLPDGTMGLTVHAVQDIVQRMNWTGRCQIGVLPETLSVEVVEQDGRAYWVATLFARDEKTGQAQSGTSSEPQRLKLKKSTAAAKRARGETIPEDDTVFDVHSRTKAINKAERNAQAKFIPEEIEQSVIAMFANDPARVQRIQTAEEAKVAEMPPPLTDDRAKALVAECDAVYKQISAAREGQGKIAFPPGQYNAYMVRSQHSHERLEAFVEHLRERLAQIEGAA